MVRLGVGVSDAARAGAAARAAAREARESLGGDAALAVTFVSTSYEDAPDVSAALREVLGDVPVVGGTAGGTVFGDGRIASRGVSVLLLGGGLEVVVRSAIASSSQMLDVVPAAAEIERAAVDAAHRGFVEHACLVFAPGLTVDGDALVAAVRKGAGAGTQLAGALTGDDLTMDRPAIFCDGELVADRVVLVGLYTRTKVGIAARHGWRALGPPRTVTRAEGRRLLELDGRPALDVWLEDAACSGMPPPPDRHDLLLHLANHFPLGISDEPSASARDEVPRELVARSPSSLLEGGGVQLSATIAEQSKVRVLHGSRNDLLRASRDAASTAALRAGGKLSGALVLACSGRLGALSEAFCEEPAQIAEQLGVPFSGACVFGEIARNVRDADAFFNLTAVVIAFGNRAVDA